MSPAAPRKNTKTTSEKNETNETNEKNKKKKPAAKPKTRVKTRTKTAKTYKATKAKKRAGKTSHKKSPIRKLTKTILTIAASAYMAIGVYLYINQRKFIYFPTQGVHPTDEQAIELQNQNETLRGWVANPRREDAIIYFGGNAERIENSIEDYKALFDDFTIYFINYRGYGESTGTPTEANLFSDAEAIFDYIQQNHTHITVIGRSLGSGVATHLAANRDIHELILVTPFDNLASVAQSRYPMFPVKLMMRDQYNSAEYAPQVTAPTLIILAANDQVVPAYSTDNLIEQFNPNTVHTAIIENATNYNIQNYTRYFMRMRDFQLTGR